MIIGVRPMSVGYRSKRQQVIMIKDRPDVVHSIVVKQSFANNFRLPSPIELQGGKNIGEQRDRLRETIASTQVPHKRYPSGGRVVDSEAYKQRCRMSFW